MQKEIRIGSIRISNSVPFVLIAGPCVIEGEKTTLKIAEKLKKITADLKIPFIFKTSYDKANRSSHRSFRGLGLAEGLKILARIKKELNLPILTDVHHPEEVRLTAEIVDILQIPAFLCRQTDLILAAARSNKPVNVKKGQFLAPEDMTNITAKIESAGNRKILLTERGTFFGYHNLVVDFRALVIMKKTGYPVIFDATHSVQLPGGKGTASGGQREFVFPLAKSALSLGIAGLFIETHFQPAKALSDGPNMLPLSRLPAFLKTIKSLDYLVKGK